MRIGRVALRLAAAAALVLCIVVAHQVTRPDHGSASLESAAVTAFVTVSQSDLVDDAPSAAPGLLHLCLAVLTGAVLVVAGWLLLAWREWPTAWRPRLVRAWRVPARPPPRPHGSALLVSLCVMRT